MCPWVKHALLRSAGASLQALPEGPRAPHDPGDGLAAAYSFYLPLLVPLPPSLLFLWDCRSWVLGPSEQKPETLPGCAYWMCLLVFAGQLLGGCQQDALGHLGVPAGFLVTF